MRCALSLVILNFIFSATSASSNPAQPATVDKSVAHIGAGAARAPLVVVIDPGHGGSNSGARGDGLLERSLTLDYARELAEQLERRGAQVVMTRDRDAFLTLRQRSDIANAADADLLVSLHANASPDDSRRGFETYLLSPEALDIDARALRTEDGNSRPGLSRRVNRLIDDVERGTAHPRAAEIAVAIQQQLAIARPDSLDRGVKQESMHVLLGARMPAVLIEVGFLDHPIEGPELADPATRTRIAAAIASAIAKTGPRTSH